MHTSIYLIKLLRIVIIDQFMYRVQVLIRLNTKVPTLEP